MKAKERGESSIPPPLLTICYFTMSYFHSMPLVDCQFYLHNATKIRGFVESSKFFTEKVTSRGNENGNSFVL